MEKIVKRNCNYGDILLLKGDTVFISEPYNFGKQKIFDKNRNLLFFGQVNSNDFEHAPKPSFYEMEAKAILLKIVPKNCYWKDMENLTNTPIHYVINDMQEYAQSERLKARNEIIQECIEKVKEFYSHSYLFEELEKLKSKTI